MIFETGGYVAIHRSIRNHWIWQDAVKLKWWLDILLEVNHAQKNVNLGFGLFECNRGQSVKSLESWAKGWRTDKSTVRRFFNLLQTDGMLSTENLKKTTRITVCNYDSYNIPKHDEETQQKRNRNATETQRNANNKDNKGNKEKKDNNADMPPSLELVIEYFTSNGYSQDIAEKAYKYYAENGWRDKNNKEVKAWKQKMVANWFDEKNKVQPQQKKMVY